MRWEDLFADLEGQLAALGQDDLQAEIADRTRHEVAGMGLLDRLAGAHGATVTVSVRGSGPCTGRLLASGPEWLLVAETPARRTLLALGAVVAVAGLGPLSRASGSQSLVASRLGLAHALRGIARDRSGLVLVLVDGTQLAGTIDRVGADFLELAEHAAAEPRRQALVTGVRTVPLAALALVRGA